MTTKTWRASGTVIRSRYLGHVGAASAEEALTKALKLVCRIDGCTCEDAEVQKVTVEREAPDGSWETLESDPDRRDAEIARLRKLLQAVVDAHDAGSTVHGINMARSVFAEKT